MDEIILASASPRRKSLLEQWGVPFRVVPSHINEEDLDLPDNPREKAKILALAKAENVAKKIGTGAVLGADTVVVFNNTVFGKPKDYSDAFYMLKTLEGKSHKVITGIAVVKAKNGFYKTAYEETEVHFAHITDNEIHEYIETGEPMGKAGAYAIQGKGALFVDKIEGCYNNIVGLPLVLVNKLLKEINTGEET